MYTLWRPSPDAAYMARSRRSRASSTPRFEAASSSTTSRFAAPVQTRVQESHSPHGSPAVPEPRRSQLSAIARIRAAVVLPTPRGPANRYPCAARPPATAPRRAAAMCSCTIRSANFLGRYFRASAIIARNLRQTPNVECSMPISKGLRWTLNIGHSSLDIGKWNAPGTPQRRPTSLSAAPCEGLTRFTSGRPADLGRPKLACRLPVLYRRRTTPPRYGRGHPDCSNRRSTESTPAYSVWSRAAWAASRTPALRRAVLYVIQWFSTAARPRANPAHGTWPRANWVACPAKARTT